MDSARNRPQSAKGRRRPLVSITPPSTSSSHSSASKHEEDTQIQSKLSSSKSITLAKSKPRPLVRGLSHDSMLPGVSLPPRSSSASLSKYKCLPSIGDQDSSKVEKRTLHFQPHPPINHTNLSSFKRGYLARTYSDSKSCQEISIPPEPDEQDEDRIMLAVKLEGGERIERWFRESNTLRDVIQFAAYTVKSKKVLNSVLVTNEIPKRQFDDLSITIAEAGIKQRTLLYAHSR